jgi:hypothetical protein
MNDNQEIQSVRKCLSCGSEPLTLEAYTPSTGPWTLAIAVCSVCKSANHSSISDQVQGCNHFGYGFITTGSSSVNDGVNGLPRTGIPKHFRSNMPYTITVVDRDNRVVYVRGATWLETISFKLLESVRRLVKRMKRE